jgi:hypothetical protein
MRSLIEADMKKRLSNKPELIDKSKQKQYMWPVWPYTSENHLADRQQSCPTSQSSVVDLLRDMGTWKPFALKMSVSILS